MLMGSDSIGYGVRKSCLWRQEVVVVVSESHGHVVTNDYGVEKKWLWS
jgi:hypothetical protein